MGEDLRLRQPDGDTPLSHLHQGLFQVNTGLDLPIVSEDKALGGKGKPHAVKVAAIFKLGHIGVVVIHHGQLADLRQLGPEHHSVNLRRLGCSVRRGPPRKKAPQAHCGTEDHPQHQRPDKFQGMEFCLLHNGSSLPRRRACGVFLHDTRNHRKKQEEASSGQSAGRPSGGPSKSGLITSPRRCTRRGRSQGSTRPESWTWGRAAPRWGQTRSSSKRPAASASKDTR